MKKHYLIAGMHCRSCELLLEQNIGKLPGVHSVHVDHRKGTATVTYDHAATPDDRAIDSAVRDAGYRLGTSERASWISHDPADWQDAIIAGCLFFVLFLAWKIIGLETLGSRVSTMAGPGTALILGLIAGVSTCMALIGGLVVGMSARHAQQYPSATAWQKTVPNIAFNAGRIGGFAVLGGVVGVAGSVLGFSGSILGFFVMAAGLAMAILGMKLSGLFPRIQNMTLPASIGRFVGLNRQSNDYSHVRTALTGALTFLVPCGFTQVVQVYAVSTGSFMQGALVMAAFAIGTTPGLFAAGSISAMARGGFGRMFLRTAGIGVLILGLWNISNGWNLTGIILNTSATRTVGAGTRNQRTATAQLRGGKQYVAMEQSTYGYSLDRIIVKRGIPVVWQVNSTNSYTCASSLRIPTLNLATTLKSGVNTIEFMPQQTGPIRFSCSMGMYGGIIDVID